MSRRDANRASKAVIEPLRRAMYEGDAAATRDALRSVMWPDAGVHLAHPFESMIGPENAFDNAFSKLHDAMPDLERRDTIVIAGATEYGEEWVGCCGYYTGAFRKPFLGIPPNGQQATMRFHEFYNIVDGRVIQMQALWDIPELMFRVGAWPMGPALRTAWNVPAPATQDGLSVDCDDEARAATSCTVVADMLAKMGRHPAEPPEVMELEKFWHPKMSWYGPAGIGTCRGIAGFRNGHQIPFLKALPDRKGAVSSGHYFGEGDYVAFTAWPGMQMTVVKDGWLGIVPTGRKITMRSLDFWRVEDGLIRENWVLVDLLDVWNQLGVDVLGRMHELTQTIDRDAAWRVGN